MTPPPQSQASGTEFHLFPRLPAELRDEIWTLAWFMSPISAGDRHTCILEVDRKKLQTDKAEAVTRKVQEPRNFALLATCLEARTIAQKHGYIRDYDPKDDILYITDSLFQLFTGDLCGRVHEGWVLKIRHLALALPVADYGLWLPIALDRLRSLETLSVVYPQPRGVVDCHQDVLNEKPLAPLRLLTEDERQGLTIEADYEYETHGAPDGYIDIRWSKNVQQHLELVENNLCSHTGRPWVETYPRIWDHAQGRLKLEYQARCFDHSAWKKYLANMPRGMKRKEATPSL